MSVYKYTVFDPINDSPINQPDNLPDNLKHLPFSLCHDVLFPHELLIKAWSPTSTQRYIDNIIKSWDTVRSEGAFQKLYERFIRGHMRDYLEYADHLEQRDIREESATVQVYWEDLRDIDRERWDGISCVQALKRKDEEARKLKAVADEQARQKAKAELDIMVKVKAKGKSAKRRGKGKQRDMGDGEHSDSSKTPEIAGIEIQDDLLSGTESYEAEGEDYTSFSQILDLRLRTPLTSSTKMGPTKPDIVVLTTDLIWTQVYLFIELKWRQLAQELAVVLREGLYQTSWYLYVSHLLFGTRIAVAQVSQYFCRLVKLNDGTIAIEARDISDDDIARARHPNTSVSKPSSIPPSPAFHRPPPDPFSSSSECNTSHCNNQAGPDMTPNYDPRMVTVEQLDRLSKMWGGFANTLFTEEVAPKKGEKAEDSLADKPVTIRKPHMESMNRLSGTVYAALYLAGTTPFEAKSTPFQLSTPMKSQFSKITQVGLSREDDPYKGSGQPVVIQPDDDDLVNLVQMKDDNKEKRARQQKTSSKRKKNPLTGHGNQGYPGRKRRKGDDSDDDKDEQKKHKQPRQRKKRGGRGGSGKGKTSEQGEGRGRACTSGGMGDQSGGGSREGGRTPVASRDEHHGCPSPPPSNMIKQKDMDGDFFMHLADMPPDRIEWWDYSSHLHAAKVNYLIVTPEEMDRIVLNISDPFGNPIEQRLREPTSIVSASTLATQAHLVTPPEKSRQTVTVAEGVLEAPRETGLPDDFQSKAFNGESLMSGDFARNTEAQ